MTSDRITSYFTFEMKIDHVPGSFIGIRYIPYPEYNNVEQTCSMIIPHLLRFD